MKALAVLLLCFLAGTAAAQNYPNRPVRLVVGFPPGGGTDILARMLAPRLSEYLGQPFVVENRPGATTNIASDLVARSAPDGYTLLFTTSSLAINASLYKNLTYDALRDFVPISVFAESPNLLVAHASAGASVKELLAQAKAKPGHMNYSSAGSGTSQHLAGELFKARTGTYIVHIPYKGSAASLTAVIAGEVHFSYANVPAILGHVRFLSSDLLEGRGPGSRGDSLAQAYVDYYAAATDYNRAQFRLGRLVRIDRHRQAAKLHDGGHQEKTSLRGREIASPDEKSRGTGKILRIAATDSNHRHPPHDDPVHGDP